MLVIIGSSCLLIQQILYVQGLPEFISHLTKDRAGLFLLDHIYLTDHEIISFIRKKGK
jgi:hypothetical protein